MAGLQVVQQGTQANVLKSNMVGLTKNKGHLCNITVDLYIYNNYSLSQYHNVILHEHAAFSH